MANSLIIPPYRAALLTGADGAPMVRANGPDSEPVLTEKQWYMFWQNLAGQLNANTQALEGLGNIVTFGNHADRPDPGPWPDGALYVEWDRGSVLYQNQGGIWVYIAGQMFGTLSPDQRPTDLAMPDAGFAFRTNVDPARAFAWSGTAWIETTPIRYGTHAERLAETIADLVSGMLWAETDRGDVFYQNQGGTWQYLTGTMYGTLSPDQRPTDLTGAQDAGFQFRTNVDPARAFAWSGGSWIETTPVRFGTHAERLAETIANLASGMLWMETDRGNVMYQLQIGVWLYLGGEMWGTLSPDQRPTDLGVNDTGFHFVATVSPIREFIWSSSAWVETGGVSGSNLTHPNVVTKVGTAGQIVEGGITDASAGNSGVVQITAAGNVGIGATPTVGLLVYRTTGNPALRAESASTASFPLLQLVDGRAGGTAWNVENGREAASTLGFFGGGATRVVFTTGGLVGIGVTGPVYQFQLSLDSAGKPATSTWSVVSDLRLKQNIEPVKEDSLAILDKLDWVRFEYNGLADMPRGLKAIGLVAQALRDQMPEAVRSEKTKLTADDAEESDVLAIDYHYVLVHSARAIQQLSAEVKRLAALIEKPA